MWFTISSCIRRFLMYSFQRSKFSARRILVDKVQTGNVPTPREERGVHNADQPKLALQSSEIVFLRQSLAAARSEIKNAKLDADAAKGALKETEKKLRRVQARIDDPDASLIRQIAARAAYKFFNRITAPVTHFFNLSLRQTATEIPRSDGNGFANRAVESFEAAPIEEPDLFALRLMKAHVRIAVVVHLADPRLWSGVCRSLTNIVEGFDLFVTLTKDTGGASDLIRESFPAAQILEFEPRGRDIYPLVALINSGVLSQYDVVCKLHANEEGWDQGIVGDPVRVEAVLAAFDADPNLGIVGEASSVDQERPVGNDRTRLRQFCAQMGIYRGDAVDQLSGIPQSCWIRPFLLRILGSLNLTASAFGSVECPGDDTTASAVERLLVVLCRDSGMRLMELDALAAAPQLGPPTTSAPRISVVAFYLPQFHPIPENDAWWGAGFTEWTKVTRARPQFSGHRQPRLPADLGYYDLRLPEIRDAQAGLAHQYGLAAFCYYYYWFDGQKLLHRPLEEILAAGTPDFPFLLMWANEPWTRAWDGRSRDILMPQEYVGNWVRNLARDVAPALLDPRYFRFQGAPVFVVYRLKPIPDPFGAFREFRAALTELGIARIHLVGSWPHFPGDEPLPSDPVSLGLDAYVEFQPRGLTSYRRRNLELAATNPRFIGNLYDYETAVDSALNMLDEPVVGMRHRGVTMGWDNTPRRGSSGTLYHGATPANFRRWLRGVVEHELMTEGPPERLIFINAWNEWAEGTYLEPDEDFGRGWLEAVASALPTGYRV